MPIKAPAVDLSKKIFLIFAQNFEVGEIMDKVTVLNKWYKLRLYPTEDQKVFLSKSFGVRFIYNRMLHDRIGYYKETGKSSYLKLVG